MSNTWTVVRQPQVDDVTHLDVPVRSHRDVCSEQVENLTEPLGDIGGIGIRQGVAQRFIAHAKRKRKAAK